MTDRRADVIYTVDDAIAEGIVAPTDILPTTPRFLVGGVVVSDGVLALVDHDLTRLRPLVQRHSQGDWGELDAEDAAEQAARLRRGIVVTGLLMSVWSLDETALWIVTTGNGHGPDTVTTVLLPQEY